MILSERLIQDFILDHARSPRHYGKLDNAIIYEANNPGCNDSLLIYFKEEKGKLIFSFEASGCILSKACASILIDEINQRTLEEIKICSHDFLINKLSSKIIYSRPKCTMLALDIVKTIVKEVESESVNM